MEQTILNNYFRDQKVATAFFEVSTCMVECKKVIVKKFKSRVVVLMGKYFSSFYSIVIERRHLLFEFEDMKTHFITN